MSKSVNLDQVQTEIGEFIAQSQTAILATCNSENLPEASYAAFVEENNHFYIYVSELAAHTNNLALKKQCSFMLIEPEESAKNPFARKRLSMRCQASECLRGSLDFEAVMDQFQFRFGKFISVIRDLQDFHLYRLTPESGNYVSGFAKAFALSGDKLAEIRHRTEKAHVSPDQETANAMADLAE